MTFRQHENQLRAAWLAFTSAVRVFEEDTGLTVELSTDDGWSRPLECDIELKGKLRLRPAESK